MRGTNTMTLNAETMRAAVEYWLNREVMRESVPHVVKSIVVPTVEPSYGGRGSSGTHEPNTFTLTIEPKPAEEPEAPRG